MSLYTKYRPRDWDSVIGQDRIKTILQSSLTHDRVGHAYLFHGSRGTGKTTSARILAKGVNCTDLRDGNPCHKCANCIAFDEGTMLDIIEIDAASNTGVDNIRELIERARFEPNQGRYKIYIIDEVHMLSTGAFNALLKTLEEPPAHVKFILATTEVEKVPETIRSRALRFDFRKITESDIIERLRFVISEERIQAEEAAIVIIAKYARGGLRDALTLLEQNTIDSELSVEHVRMTLSLLEESYIDEIIESLRTSDIYSILDTIAKFRDMYVNARGFFEQMMYRLRDKIVEHLDDGLYREYMELYRMFEDAYTRVRTIPDGMLLIEITLLKIVKRGDEHKEGRIKETANEMKKDENSKIGVRGEGTVGTKIIASKTAEQNKKEGTGLPSETFDAFDHKNMKNSAGKEDTGFLSESILREGGVQEGQKQSEQDISSSPQTQTALSTGQESDTNNPETKSPQKHYPPTSLGRESTQIPQRSNTPTLEHSNPPPFSYITLLDRVKGTKPALVIDLKTARFDVSGKHITFIFSKNWNYSRVNTPDIRGTLAEVLSTTFGGEWSVDCKLEESKVQTSIADDVF